jgi:outer membrane autotransporter protein
LCATTICSISGSAVAQEKSDFYITGGAGIAIGPKTSEQFKESVPENNFEGDFISSERNVKTSSTKPAKGAQFFAGLGYRVTDDFRVEAVFVKPLISYSKFKEQINEKININGQEASRNIMNNIDVKLNAKINSFQLRGYYDVLKLSEDANLYVGAGVGLSQVKYSVNVKNIEFHMNQSKNNFTWMLGVGTDFKITEKMKIGLEYNYSDFGKAKKLPDVTKTHSFKTHAVLAKLTLDI